MFAELWDSIRTILYQTPSYSPVPVRNDQWSFPICQFHLKRQKICAAYHNEGVPVCAINAKPEAISYELETIKYFCWTTVLYMH